MHYYQAQPSRSQLMIGVILCVVTMVFLAFVFGHN